jgi:hypothetical protein
VKDVTMKRVQHRIAAALLTPALLAVLAGCDLTIDTPSTVESADPTPSETVTPIETADPVVEPLTIPDCETLLPLALAQSSFGASTAFLGENPPTDYYPWYQLPAVNTAIDGLTLARACWFGIPNSDGGFSFMVAEIDPETRTAIEAALTTEGFSSVVMGTVTAREAQRDGEFQIEAETHLFTGDVWIIADDGDLSVSGVVAGSALDAMRAANPTLGL